MTKSKNNRNYKTSDMPKVTFHSGYLEGVLKAKAWQTQ